MASTMHLDIVSAEKAIFSGPVEMVFAPAVSGEVGIMPRHTALITTLRPGEVRAVHEGGQEESFYVSGGILEIQPHVVTVLSDTAARAEDLDEAAALAAKERVEAALRDQRSEVDFAAARSELAELAAQLQAIRRLSRGLRK